MQASKLFLTISPVRDYHQNIIDANGSHFQVLFFHRGKKYTKKIFRSAGAGIKTIYTIETKEDGLLYLERREAGLQKIGETRQEA